MNVEIADIILGKISGLTFLDRKAGLVRPVIIMQPGGPDGKGVRKVFPVACNVSGTDCNSQGKYKDLIPDSSKKSILYFEDGGVQITGADQINIQCRSNLKLVCWLNGKRLGYDGCGISTIASMHIIKALTSVKNGFNEGNMIKITITPTGEDPKTNGIFGKYTYDEAITQYLMYPFDYFALNIRTDFSLPVACIPDYEDLPPTEC